MSQTRERIIVEGNADPITDVENAARAIRSANWWERAGQVEAWPLSTFRAAGLLFNAGEFDCTHCDLSELVTGNLMPRPGVDEAGELEWSAVDILNAARILEFRQQWRADSEAHKAKKSLWLLTLEDARARRRVHELLLVDHGQPVYDLKHIFATLARCDSREGREMLLVLLRARLEWSNGVVI